MLKLLYKVLNNFLLKPTRAKNNNLKGMVVLNKSKQVNVTDTITNNFMPYSAYVILERALPEIDGFKPSQRRILYTMYKMGLLNSVRKKSQGIVGQTMFLHPHGDMSIYETLVRMTKDAESLNVPYIDSKGNFGKHYLRDTQFASARYTECRLMPISSELFRDINKNAVDMIDNYDNTLKEPRLLPVSIPTILLNSQSGVAVGMASNITPYNINEVLDYIIAYLKDDSVQVKDYILAPDFSTGGDIIYDEKSLNSILDTGKGSISIRAKHKIEGNTILFTEIPYTTTLEAITDKIADLVKEGKIKEIVDINDMTGIGTTGIEVVVKSSTNKELLVEKLYKNTPLQSNFSANFNIIIDGKPKVLGVKDVVKEWLKFRKQTIKNATIFDRNEKIKLKHLYSALVKISLDIEKVILVIRETKKHSDIIKNLMKEFEIDEEQATFVAEIKLRNLNEEYIIKKQKEIVQLEKDIDKLNMVINDSKTLSKLIINQLTEIKKNYGQERKSNVIHVDTIINVNIEELDIEDYNLKLFVTKDGYLKKIPLTSLRGASDIKLKENDELVDEIEISNNSDVLVFTDKNNVYKIKTYDIENHKPSSLGEYLPTLLKLNKEQILYITATKDYSENLLIGFEDGKMAKIELKAYETKQNRQMLKNAYADKKALFFKKITDDIDIIAISDIEKVVLFNTSMINSKTSKTTIGVQIQKEKKGSKTVTYILAENFETNDIEYYRIKSSGVGKYLKKD